MTISNCEFRSVSTLPSIFLPRWRCQPNYLRLYQYVARLYKGVNDYLPSARITFENFYGIAHA